jgi:hypothetical protein
MAPVRKGPPGLIVGNDGMSCGGTLIALGDTPDRVLHLCGGPTSAKHWLLKWQVKGRTLTGSLDIWRYERYGSLPRLLRFENGVLVSLVAVSSF